MFIALLLLLLRKLQNRLMIELQPCICIILRLPFVATPQMQQNYSFGAAGTFALLFCKICSFSLPLTFASHKQKLTKKKKMNSQQNATPPRSHVHCVLVLPDYIHSINILCTCIIAIKFLMFSFRQHCCSSASRRT